MSRKRDFRPFVAIPTLQPLEDRSVPAAFAVGSIQGQDGWSGGNIPIAAAVTQGVDLSGTLSRTGVGAFVVSNKPNAGSHNGAFSGWPFSPALSVAAGQPSSGAAADLFTATFWFRSVSNAADGSNIELDMGSAAGDDRTNFMAITNRADADGGLQLRLGEPDGSTGNFFPTISPATNITRGVWHRIDITAAFIDGSANDTFSVKLDGTPVVNTRTGGTTFGTFEGYFEGVGGAYALSNRLFFRSGAAPSAFGAFADAGAQGFAFDDMSYQSALSSAPTQPLAYYAAGFETKPTLVYVDDSFSGSVGDPIADADLVTPGAQPGVFGVDVLNSVQAGVSAVAAGGTVRVFAGTYTGNVSITTAGVSVIGQGTTGLNATTVSGPIDAIAGGSTIQIAASNVTVRGFVITREGNTVADWANPNLNSVGVAIQGQAISGTVIEGNLITGNRSAIDINNSNGNTVRNNVITANHTGIIFRNQTDNTTLTGNAITGNRTVGVLFLDASGGTNVPVQSAVNSTFTGNNISGNWYAQIVDRQTGGVLPAPGSNLKNFSGNWFGSGTPVIATANSAEPGYATLIPVEFGGTATAPGGQPDIAGAASANFDITSLLASGVDLDPTAIGFQADFSTLAVLNATESAQTGVVGRLVEALGAVADGGTVRVSAGSYLEAVTVARNAQLALGRGATDTVIVNTGAVTFTPGSAFVVNVNGGTAGSGYDQLNSTGAVTLNGATLVLNAGYLPATGDTFTLITAAGGLTGTFAGLPEGATVLVSGQQYKIHYGPTAVTLALDVSDLSITVSDGKTTTTAGASTTYAITVSNTGPNAVTGAVLSVILPPGLTGVTFTSVASGGATGNTNGSGAPADVLNLPVGGTVTYIIIGTVSPLATGTLTVTATITPPSAATFDPNTANNTAIDTDTVFVPDTTRPTLTQVVNGALTATAPSTVTVTFSEAVSDFDITDLIVIGGTVSGFSGSGASYTFTLTPTVAGEVTVLVPNGAAVDASGNLSVANTSVFVAAPLPVTPTPTPRPAVVTAVGETIQVFDPTTGNTRTFTPFPGFHGEVHLATADLNADGVLDIVVGAGAGGGPHVKVFDGASGQETLSFYAYDPSFSGGVFVAASADGRIVTGAGAGGGPHVKVFNTSGSELASFYAYDSSFSGGVRVALGDINGDGVADIVTGAGAGGGPHVKAFDGSSMVEQLSVMAFDSNFSGGVFVAVANGQIAVGAGEGGGPHVKLFNQFGVETQSFYAYDPAFSGGVRVGFADADADGDLDLVTAAGPGGGPHVKAFSFAPFAEVRSVFVGDALDSRGVFVA